MAIVVATRATPADPDSAVYIGQAAWLILVAMIFDALDGYAARLSKTASDFGGQLDSLCDAVSFGMAPGFVLWRMTLVSEQGAWHSRGVVVVGILYMCCAILRLARF